ncbi:MAG: hypothetical protein R3298_05945 [Gammaproteobacteria bacterium]|nr:hypothetical protein [Gammaproteobacteria bacterium]
MARSDDRGRVVASVEPSGLVIEGDMSPEEFATWLVLFVDRASAALGFEVRDAGGVTRARRAAQPRRTSAIIF